MCRYQCKETCFVTIERLIQSEEGKKQDAASEVQLSTGRWQQRMQDVSRAAEQRIPSLSLLAKWSPFLAQGRSPDPEVLADRSAAAAL